VVVGRTSPLPPGCSTNGLLVVVGSTSGFGFLVGSKKDGVTGTASKGVFVTPPSLLPSGDGVEKVDQGP